MPKLAISFSPPTSACIHTHLHPHPHRPRPRIPRSRCASSHVRPLAYRHDSPLYQKPNSTSSPNPLPHLPSEPSGFGFSFNPRTKYSLTDDLNPHNKDHKPPDERIIKLGKTLRTLSPLLPTILTNPLPSNILSPSVTLHLFPSTHPHLPTVKGRTLYRAALWAVPVAWSSVPLVGNVKLRILGERIVRGGFHGNMHLPNTNNGDGDERLVVRWRTEPTSSHSHSPSSTTSTTTGSPSTTPINNASSSNTSSKSNANGTNKSLSVLLGGDAPIFKLSSEDQFTGLFIFSFDEEGRVLTQTIEHAEDASGWERTAKFVTLTDWLIGKARGSLDPAPEPGLVGCSGLEITIHTRHECQPSNLTRA
ncbi:hypothetical protein BJX99DRAFT_245838 [Aspergillus californicus]